MSASEITLLAQPRLTVYHPSLQQYVTSIENALGSGDAPAARRALGELKALLTQATAKGEPGHAMQSAVTDLTTALSSAAASNASENLTQTQPLPEPTSPGSVQAEPPVWDTSSRASTNLAPADGIGTETGTRLDENA
jgi:hypothetical protein